MKAEIYLPTNALFLNDVKSRYEMLRPVVGKGFTTGLMLILGSKSLSQESIKRQLDNLEVISNQYPDDLPGIFLMHPNKPIDGPNRLNFLDNPEWSQDYVKSTIDFASQIPTSLTPKSGQMVSFHLNTLVDPASYEAVSRDRQNLFERVLSNIRKLAIYAKQKNVTLAVETTPIPEFGDITKGVDNFIVASSCYWSDLKNPWPLFFWRDEIKRLRETGCNITIDLCHSFISMKTLEQLKQLPKDKKETALFEYGILESDLDAFSGLDQFVPLVLANTAANDSWHVSDAAGMYRTKNLFGADYVFKEGVSLLSGEIPEHDLTALFNKGIDKPIKMVFEVNETDFVNSPNTRKSLEVFMDLLSKSSD